MERLDKRMAFDWSGLIRGVAFNWSGFDWRDLIRGVAFDLSGLIGEMAFNWRDLIRGMAFVLNIFHSQLNE